MPEPGCALRCSLAWTKRYFLAMPRIAEAIPFVVVALWILSTSTLAAGGLEPATTDQLLGSREALTPTWTLEIGEDLAASEYWITWQDQIQLGEIAEALQAPNRAQGFRAYFTADGFHMVPRTAKPSDWVWGLSLETHGRGSHFQPVESARLTPDGNSIEMDRRGIVEWIVNRPQGLKHGLIVHGPPEGDPDPTERNQPVRLDFRVTGSLAPVVEPDGQSIRFEGQSGLGVVYYGGLEVWDALNRALPARMEAYFLSDASMVRLLVDDREAVYPVTIDPVATTAAWMTDSDQENARLGLSVGTAGDVNSDGFDDVIVGAFRWDGGFAGEGAAFLYLGSAEGPSETFDWRYEGDELGASLGVSVGTAGDVNSDGYDDMIVGAHTLDNGGGAFVFHGSPTGPSVTPDLLLQSNQSNNSGFGRRVGTAGDVNGDGYDDVVVGATLYDLDSPPGISQDGRVFVYHGSASGLSLQPDWIAAGNQSLCHFGLDVATAVDVNSDGYDDVMVGADSFDNGETDEGRAYVYHGSSSGLSMDADWIFENNVVRACLGKVGAAGDVNGDGYDDVVVGAAYNSCWDAGSSPLGKAYGFHGSADGLAVTPNWETEVVQIGALYGQSVGSAGDPNDDGFDDVLIGALTFENGEAGEGAVWLYLGSEAGLATEAAWMIEGDQAGAQSGRMAVTAGDVNGDGLDDVIVGADKYDNPEENEGAAFLYLGLGDAVPAGWVAADAPLLLSKPGGGAVQLDWGPSCLAGDADYEVYEGQLGDFASHEPRACSTAGATEFTLVPGSGSTYYLAVPASLNREGSYGRSSDDLERPPGGVACLPQVIGSCD